MLAAETETEAEAEAEAEVEAEAEAEVEAVEVAVEVAEVEVEAEVEAEAEAAEPLPPPPLPLPPTVQCQGFAPARLCPVRQTLHRARCTVCSRDKGAAAQPLREGERFCEHHRPQHRPSTPEEDLPSQQPSDSKRKKDHMDEDEASASTPAVFSASLPVSLTKRSRKRGEGGEALAAAPAGESSLACSGPGSTEPASEASSKAGAAAGPVAVLSAAQQELLHAAIEEMRASKTNFHAVCLGWDLTKTWRTTGAFGKRTRVTAADIAVIDPSDGENLRSYKQIWLKLEVRGMQETPPRSVQPQGTPKCSRLSSSSEASAGAMTSLAACTNDDALHARSSPRLLHAHSSGSSGAALPVASSGGQLSLTTAAPSTAPSSRAACNPPAAAVGALAAGQRVLARFHASDALRQPAEPDGRGGRGAVLQLWQTQWYAGVIREVRTHSHAQCVCI